MSKTQINFNQTCSSHMPMLIEFIKVFKPARILEFGSGFFSTGLFSKKCKEFTSIEIASKDWFDMVSRRYKNDSWKFVFAQTHKEALDNLYGTFDLIFVDCIIPRYEIVNNSFYHTENIICHDTQLHWTKQFDIPEEFKVIIFNKFPIKYSQHRNDAYADRPWTTLYSKNKEVIEYFRQINEKALYQKHKFPYGIK